MKTLLVIGQAPSRTADRFTGTSGRRLAALAGMSHETFIDVTERVNVLDRRTARSGRGDAFPMAEAKRRAALIDVSDRDVLIVGFATARAFGLNATGCQRVDPAIFPASNRPRSCRVVPHPSGVNRWWNDSRNIEQARSVLRDALMIQRNEEEITDGYEGSRYRN